MFLEPVSILHSHCLYQVGLIFLQLLDAFFPILLILYRYYKQNGKPHCTHKPISQARTRKCHMEALKLNPTEDLPQATSALGTENSQRALMAFPC